MFDESWDTVKTRFDGIIINIARHQRLIESQATSFEIEEAQENVPRYQFNRDGQPSEQDLRRLLDVHNWLRASNVEIDQGNHQKARAEYPGTGRWLLNAAAFRDWFNPQFPAIPPLLWVNGIPGAGKLTAPWY